tara:strand:+ start:195 stop:593 length:399 start_codon:yes stop_codon:yes gene_type:complete
VSNEKEAIQLEDLIINKFIEEELPVFEEPGLDGDAKYDTLNPTDKEAYDLSTFQFFHEAQKAKAQSNDKYNSMEFPNFVKLFNPKKGFLEVLRDKTSEPGPANVWHDIYNRDTSKMKESALRGLRSMLASRM